MIIDILFFHCSFVDMLNIISTCRDILCVDINVDKRCVDHGTSYYPPQVLIIDWFLQIRHKWEPT